MLNKILEAAPQFILFSLSSNQLFIIHFNFLLKYNQLDNHNIYLLIILFNLFIFEYNIDSYILFIILLLLI